ncbi:protein FAR1-RELATED SEQUENCE 6-like [Arachis ipaensis]|uniref:protein FAR1-RELATED SEQUENCE 6-like n=1 Tax=Arachis ipaensis TaxID=130454 RepID=UPI0007AF455D|nr:protein FAR1-RELATED SEQUENCE 6-like [Arachis ipaensis]
MAENRGRLMVQTRYSESESESECQKNKRRPYFLYDVDEQLVPKVEMTFNTLENAIKFYKDYSKINESEESEFFFELEFEVDQSIKIAFWANTRSRAAYEYFGDVISFDIIYNTNRYNLVFGNVPKGILIDQCVSIQRAIEACMPTIIQWWCICHIMKKIPSKLNGYKRHKKNEHEMSHVVRNSLTKESFDRNWNDFLMKYGLGDNKWLSGSREQRERELDAANFHTVIPCATKSSIEAQFQYVYTLEKFRKVQAQFRGKVNCITISTHSALGYTVYEVVEQVSNSTFNKFAVTYDRISAEVKCQCLLFESRGILCRHSLSVLSFERVNKVSPRYILERWSKNVKRRHIHIKSGHDEFLLEPISKRFDNLVFRSQNICKFASEFEKLTAILHRAYDNVMVEMQEYKAKRKKNVRYLTKMLPSKILTSFKASTRENKRMS